MQEGGVQPGITGCGLHSNQPCRQRLLPLPARCCLMLFCLLFCLGVGSCCWAKPKLLKLWSWTLA